MALSVNQMVAELLKECSELQPVWDKYSTSMKERASDSDFFSGAWLYLHIQNSRRKGNIDLLRRFFVALERFVITGDNEAKTLATEGFLKSLHHANSFSIKPGPQAFALWMGPEASKYWRKLCEEKVAADRLRDTEEEHARREAVLFLIRPARLWGDYGTILMNGMASRETNSGDLILDRAGPYAPPIFFPRVFPTGRCAIVTQSCRHFLEVAGLRRLTFRPVYKRNIIDIPWHTWDRLEKFPAIVPESGEPEDFILNREGSDKASQEMGELWELQAPAVPCEITQENSESSTRSSLKRLIIKPASGDYQGLFGPIKNSRMLLADEPTRLLFEQHAGDWVQFDYVIPAH